MLAHLDSLVWLLAFVQLAGLAAAAAARHHQGKRGQAFWQTTFLICLALAGVATLGALAIGPGSCTICGATQAVSVITAVWDLPSAGRVGL